jgi:hypothetical protein
VRAGATQDDFSLLQCEQVCVLSFSQCVYIHVCVRERENVYVCLYVRESERERGNK